MDIHKQHRRNLNANKSLYLKDIKYNTKYSSEVRTSLGLAVFGLRIHSIKQQLFTYCETEPVCNSTIGKHFGAIHYVSTNRPFWGLFEQASLCSLNSSQSPGLPSSMSASKLSPKSGHSSSSGSMSALTSNACSPCFIFSSS